MTWNYRLMRRNGFLSIHEVYYKDDGKVRTWTEDPMEPGGDTVEEVQQDLKWMARALTKPILDYETGKEIG
jgi:hypothetical protein